MAASKYHDDLDTSLIEKRGWRDTSRRLFDERRHHSSYAFPSPPIKKGFSNDENVELLKYSEAWNVKTDDDTVFKITQEIADMRETPPKDKHNRMAAAVMIRGFAIMCGVIVYLLNVHLYENIIRQPFNYTEINSSDLNGYNIIYDHYGSAVLFVPFVIMTVISTMCLGARVVSLRTDILTLTVMLIPLLASSFLLFFDVHISEVWDLVVVFICYAVFGGACGAVVTSSFSALSLYPQHYINYLLIGMNLSGVAICIVHIIVRIFTPSYRITTIYSLLVSIIGIFLAIITYIPISTSKFRRHYEHLYRLVCKDVYETDDKSSKGFPYTLRKSICLLFAVFLIYFAIFSIYPLVLADVTLESFKGFAHFDDKFWSFLINLLTYSLAALLGNLSAHICRCHRPGCLTIPALLYLPAALVLEAICKYRVHTRNLPVLIDLDFVQLTVSAVIAYLGGYLSSVALISAKQLVQASHATVAYRFVTVSMALGMGGGVCASKLYQFLVDTLGH